MAENTKICIAIVTNRSIKPLTVLSLANMIAHTEHAVHTVIATQGYTIAENRTYAVIQAQKEHCSHILFIDDDMVFPKDTIEVLLATKKKVVGVASNSRTLPLSTTVSVLDENGEHLPHDKRPPWYKMPTELFECFSIGMGVALIDMSVFSDIDTPWFAFETLKVGKVNVGEDAWFCLKAREKGIKIWCEPRLEIGHIGDYIY